jgi:hypothetical protein
LPTADASTATRSASGTTTRWRPLDQGAACDGLGGQHTAPAPAEIDDAHGSAKLEISTASGDVRYIGRILGTFPAKEICMQLSELDTPAVTIDLRRLAANILRVQDTLQRHGKANRPHIKTHKIPAVAKMQMEAGAVGITCQKLGEVETFIDAGVTDDILLTYNVIGEAKTERLMALSKRVGRLAVVLDNEVVAQGLSDATRRAGRDIPFLVECDTGMGRNGVPDARSGAGAGARRHAHARSAF